MKKKEIAKHFFARNPKLQQLFITSDGMAFEEDHKADAHAQRHKDKTVKKYDRESVMLEEVAAAKAAEDHKKAVEAAKAKEVEAAKIKEAEAVKAKEAEAAKAKAAEEAKAKEAEAAKIKEAEAAKAKAAEEAKDLPVADAQEVKSSKTTKSNPKK